MFKVEKEWKEFNISLSKFSDELKTLFPEHETNPVFKGTQANTVLELWFDKEIEGYIQDAEGNITIESGSNAESIETLWDSIIESHVIATSYASSISLEEAEQRARTDIISKTFDQLSIEQKSLLAGVDLTEEDRLQLLTDFPG